MNLRHITCHLFPAKYQPWNITPQMASDAVLSWFRCCEFENMWSTLRQRQLVGQCAIRLMKVRFKYFVQIIIFTCIVPAGWTHESSLQVICSSSWWRHQMETFSELLAICAGNSPHKGQWRGALMFSLICVWISSWVNSREAGDLRRYCAHYDVTVI